MIWPLRRRRPAPAELAAADEPAIAARRVLDPATRELVQIDVLEPILNAGRRGVAVCGPAEGAGASFFALHVAAASAYMGRRTVLIDADLRSPDRSRILRWPKPGGLLPWLLDPGEDDYPLLVPLTDGVWWMPPGGVSEIAGELLSEANFKALLDRLLRDFDLVVADTPPANRHTDGRVVADRLGSALIVARKNVSYMQDTATLARELTEDGVILVGSVLNDR